MYQVSFTGSRHLNGQEDINVEVKIVQKSFKDILIFNDDCSYLETYIILFIWFTRMPRK